MCHYSLYFNWLIEFSNIGIQFIVNNIKKMISRAVSKINHHYIRSSFETCFLDVILLLYIVTTHSKQAQRNHLTCHTL